MLKAGPLFNNQLRGQLRLIIVASGNFPLELLVVGGEGGGETEVRGGRKNTKNMEGYRWGGGGAKQPDQSF